MAMLRDKIREILDFHFWSLDKSKEENRKSIGELTDRILF